MAMGAKLWTCRTEVWEIAYVTLFKSLDNNSTIGEDSQ